jgi:hypothetical protein
MKKTTYIISMVLLGLLLLLTISYLVKIIGIILFPPSGISTLRQLSIYQWAGVGFLAFAIIRLKVKKNMKWLETFSHELTHITVALLFLRKVHSFHAEEGKGVVYTSGKHQYALAPMSLAPYCLPLFTYLLLSIRGLLDERSVWIYDILIGMTMCFHFICFWKQSSKRQTDINQFPLPFSFFYILTALLINSCIILVAFFPNYNVFTSFWRYLTSIWENAIVFINWIK